MRHIIGAMISYLELENNRDSKRNCSRLKKINLTNKEWMAIEQLIPVLRPFADATEFLGGNYIEPIDFTDPSTAFDEDIGYEDVDEDIDNNPSTYRRKIRINTPQNCDNLILRVRAALYKSLNHYYSVPTETGLMAALLDPRSKSLLFISPYDAQTTFDNLHVLFNNSNTNISATQVQENSDDSLLVRMYRRQPTNADELVHNIFPN
ncbi:10629_t:CDS:2 [Racocetra fulgida]|uniref:10629_t:CDS:1 n=1 Tax=Racocetra fulgida TaxID=60492 RepID=A0A9N8W1F2_9GLOM|nr:10629_t:CDS:2 [Racocetra fulgida]